MGKYLELKIKVRDRNLVFWHECVQILVHIGSFAASFTHNLHKQLQIIGCWPGL